MLLTLLMAAVLQQPVVPVSIDSPTDAQVLRSLPRVAGGAPVLFEIYRDDMVITKHLVVAKSIALRFPAGLRVNITLTQWQCTMFFKETITSKAPIPFQVSRNRTKVVYIDIATLVK